MICGDLHGKFFYGNAKGNTEGVGMKLASIAHGGNLIADNPAVEVGGIVSRPTGDIFLKYK